MCARRCAPGDEVKYPVKPVMRDDVGVVPCKFLAWQRETAPQAASRPEGGLPAAKIKIADNKNKKARASPWGQGTRLLLCLGNTA